MGTHKSFPQIRSSSGNLHGTEKIVTMKFRGLFQQLKKMKILIPTIVVIIFWNFSTGFWYSSDLSQVKPNLILV